MIHIKTLSVQEATHYLPSLILLLQDVVDSGASIGFLPPLSTDDAKRYWLDVISDLEKKSRILLVAVEQADEPIGSVQLALATKFNGLHRAEVQKLFVHQRVRRQGLGRLLMEAVEQTARDAGRSLLVLDTRMGDTAETLYRKIGYIQVGIIPQYARSADGDLHSTVFFYKNL